jgi:type IV secretory pathway VirB4 component
MAETHAHATQSFVPIKEVRDGVAIMRDGSLRSIIMASSINFALKSHDEQHAILAQFQAFLNTLDFSIQIVVESRRLNIEPYLELLRSKEELQANDLMRVQLREYVEFIRTFTTEVDIMVKSFFVVVPYSPVAVNIEKSLNALMTRQKKPTMSDDMRFEEHRTQLEQRVGIVESGLARIGVRTIPLGGEEIIELFYHLFNPGEEGRSAPARS